MKKIYSIIPLLLFSCSTFGQKISLKTENVINISAVGDANTLVDEQIVAGNPKSGSGGSPSTHYTNGYMNTELYYPLEVVIDLYGNYQLTDIYFYDIHSSDSLIISTGTPSGWTPIIRKVTDSYMRWTGVPVTVSTRYLHIRFKSPDTRIAELVLYGSPSGSITSPIDPEPVAMPKPLMEDLIGMNSFHDVPDNLQKVVKHIREYHNWGWDEGNGSTLYQGYPLNQYGWNPSWVSGTGWGWNFDDFYSRSKRNGLVIAPDLKEVAPYLVGHDHARHEDKPIRGNKSTTSPNSYVEHADYLFQFAARYGSNKKLSTILKLRVDNPLSSGLGYVSYIENWNEQDKYWLGRNAYFKPFEFAAMTSADYDGHLKTMGETVGVKNADPNMKVVLGGLIKFDTLYLKSMLFWAKAMRNGSFPADVINFHHYSNDVGGQTGNPTKGISPEEDRLKDRVAAVVNFRNKYLPGKEVWLSEFGYDTHTQSVQGVRAIGSQNAWEVQARWIIRSYLAIAAGGIDRAHMYMIRDVDASAAYKSIKFSTSGLTTSPMHDGTYPGYTPKTSWYYLYAFRKRLTGYYFKEEIPSGNTNVLIYAFQNANNPDSLVYAVWAPTSTDLRIDNFALQIPNALSVTKVELVNNDTMGVATSVPLNGNSVMLTVDEKPDLLIIKKRAVVTGSKSLPDNSTNTSCAVFPNPTSKLVNIEFADIQDNAKISVTDALGVVVLSTKISGLNAQLNLESLPNGVYFIDVQTNNKRESIKVVKN